MVIEDDFYIWKMLSFNFLRLLWHNGDLGVDFKHCRVIGSCELFCFCIQHWCEKKLLKTYMLITSHFQSIPTMKWREDVNFQASISKN